SICASTAVPVEDITAESAFSMMPLLGVPLTQSLSMGVMFTMTKPPLATMLELTTNEFSCAPVLHCGRLSPVMVPTCHTGEFPSSQIVIVPGVVEDGSMYNTNSPS